MSNSDLHNRAIKLQVDTLVVATGLHVVFKATKTLKPEPNTCEVQVYNLTADQRARLTKKKLPVVALAAGYGKDLTQLFLGEMLSVTHERKNADIITTISTTDGGDKHQKARLHVSFGPSTSAATALRAIAKALGVKPGNTATAVAALSKGLAANMYVEGASINGSAARELDALARSANLEWSVQDGALQFLDVGASLAKFAIVLNANSGLVGSPSIDTKGIVTGQALIIKDMLPGRQVQIDSAFLKTRARLTKCSYNGDTHGDAWTVDFEADTKGRR